MEETQDSIETLLVTIIQKHGGTELYKKENAHKLSGLLKDYAGFYFQDELRLLTRIIPDGFQEILFKANEGSLEEKKGGLKWFPLSPGGSKAARADWHRRRK